jgi:choline-glycine betaine transporter
MCHEHACARAHTLCDNERHMPRYKTYNERSEQAVNLAFFHWGLHTWMGYTISGICMGLTSQRCVA